METTVEWIKISDGLPEHEDEVLVTDGIQVKVAYFHVWDDGRPSFSRQDSGFGKVTHWMFLPKLPKVKNEDN